MAESPSEKDGGSDKGSAEKPKDRFASDRGPRSMPDIEFDSKRALGYLDELCKIGPRISGSEGMKKQQEYLKKYFEEQGGKVEMQRFEAKQKSQSDLVPMANMIVSWHPERTARVLLCSHYDTRPIADREEDQRKWHQPFLSANDGGSGVALLMELAHHIKDLKTSVGVDFVLFDGEEFIHRTGDDYFFGSRHFATTYAKNKPKYNYFAAVLMDMIAGKNPSFPVELNSWDLANPLANELWNIAAEQKCAAFKFQEGPRVEDDHIALNHARIPTVDIIDFHYKHWHRLTDLPENCSAEGMDQVARVLIVWLSRAKSP
jgi:hypothetical protein